jgi:hypothetical protein
MQAPARLWLLAACGALAACDSRVSVDATANPGAQFESVLVTVRELWVNESATAAPDDPSWIKRALPAPRTLELVGADSAAASELASALKVDAGTYRQMRLLLVDRTEPLTESAAAAGALFNDQVTLVDAAGVEATVPLEIPNAAKGVGIETDLVVPIPRDKVLAEIAAASGSGGRGSLVPNLAPPGSTVPGAVPTVPGATVPGTAPTPPGATVPGIVPTLPGATVPGTTLPSVPGETVPGTVPPVPGTTFPGTTIPGTTIPGAPVPGAPSAAVPGITVPGDTTVPDTTVPGTTAPGVTPPGVTVPGVTVPGMPVPGTTTPGAPAQTAPAAPGGASENTATLTSTLFFDATRDLVPFRFGDRAGFLLNPALVVADVDDVGTIRSQLDVSAVAPNAGTGRPDVEVTAERLDEPSNRRIEVASAAVRPDGTFSLYPLPLDRDADTTTYDLVVHGPEVTSVVIRGVPVSEGGPRTAASVDLGAIALIPSSSYAVNVDGAAPRGVRVQFYQTLADDPAPVLIEQRAVDPVTGRFATDEPLSAAPAVVYGTFGAAFTLAAAPAVEGAGRYSVAAAAPLDGESELAAATVAPPAVAGGITTFAVPATPAAATAGTITAHMTIAAPGKYDDGVLLVTHNGAVVAAAPLAGQLGQPAPAVSIGVPAGTPSAEFARGLYFLETWAWSSANPVASFTRQPANTAVDVRAAPQATVEIPLN